ncbi:MAG: hypothetical protein WCR42_00350 [bacterium]
MTDLEIKDFCDEIYKHDEPVVVIPEFFYENAEFEQALSVVEEFSGRKFIRLPEKDIEFFEWLKTADEEVWKDLWEGDELPPYIVSINLLPELIYKQNRGFPICDLVSCDNYYFAVEFMQDEESNIVLEAARTRLLNHEPLTYAQKLALEISIWPIDIWRFAYKYRISVSEAKNAVQELVDDFALVHLKSAEHIAKALNF